MIPSFNVSGVLPPHKGTRPTVPGELAPYSTTATNLVQRFASSPERIKILHGLLDYRAALREVGIRDGFQWIDGSFVENVEDNLGRPPADIDVVTFAGRPESDSAEWLRLIEGNRYLFDRVKMKERFLCDGYYVDLGLPPHLIVGRATYWFGLFSHQRVTAIWKGLVRLPLVSDDEHARKLLAS